MRSYFERSATVGLFATLILCLTVLVPVKGKHVDGKDDVVWEGTPAPAVVKVSTKNMQFSPNTLRVKKGTVVEWTNDDVVPHTVTSASFDSGSLGPGKSWRHKFTEAGQVRYACTFHPTMTGVVIVK